MSSTYLSLHYHIVFGTKNREPVIANEWREKLHEYIGGTIRGLGGYPQGVNGTSDHVHILVGLRATHCLADFIRELKKSSSFWIHTTVGRKSFYWQEGYGAFTVSVSNRAAVMKYIANQMEHHRIKTFEEEFRDMLKKAGIRYDPKYFA